MAEELVEADGNLVVEGKEHHGVLVLLPGRLVEAEVEALVEEALHLTVEDEVRKEMRVGGHVDVEDMSDIAFRRIYDDDLPNLIKRFRSQMGYSQRGGFSLTQAKEFNYWLFKLRLEYWDPARVASDTRKGLKRLEQVRGTSSPV